MGKQEQKYGPFSKTDISMGSPAKTPMAWELLFVTVEHSSVCNSHSHRWLWEKEIGGASRGGQALP